MSKDWIIISDDQPDARLARSVNLTCMNCLEESAIKVVGLALAQVEMGLVFDSSEYQMPQTIRCPHCRSTFTSEAP